MGPDRLGLRRRRRGGSPSRSGANPASRLRDRLGAGSVRLTTFPDVRHCSTVVDDRPRRASRSGSFRPARGGGRARRDSHDEHACRQRWPCSPMLSRGPSASPACTSSTRPSWSSWWRSSAPNVPRPGGPRRRRLDGQPGSTDRRPPRCSAYTGQPACTPSGARPTHWSRRCACSPSCRPRGPATGLGPLGGASGCRRRRIRRRRPRRGRGQSLAGARERDRALADDPRVLEAGARGEERGHRGHRGHADALRDRRDCARRLRFLARTRTSSAPPRRTPGGSPRRGDAERRIGPEHASIFLSARSLPSATTTSPE